MMWDNILRRLFFLPVVIRATQGFNCCKGAADTYDCCQEVQVTGETIKSAPNKIAGFLSQ